MYGISIIKKILFIKDREKLSIRKTAKRFALSTRAVHKWDKGIISKGARICQARKLDMEGLKEDVNKHRDLYQYERATKFKLGYVPQYGGFFHDLTLFENLKAIGEILIKNSRERETKINQLI